MRLLYSIVLLDPVCKNRMPTHLLTGMELQTMFGDFRHHTEDFEIVRAGLSHRFQDCLSSLYPGTLEFVDKSLADEFLIFLSLITLRTYRIITISVVPDEYEVFPFEDLFYA